MNRTLRDESLAALPAGVRGRTGLGDLSREYSLAEIAVITRAGPARMLGLAAKGHLGPGADADVTVYAPGDDKERMFALPRYVIKAGEIVVDDGEIRTSALGRTFHVEPGYDEAVVPGLREWFEGGYTLQFANYPVAADDVANPARVPAAGVSDS
jgi:formylmethanofuran dehydrogenase subunit A